MKKYTAKIIIRGEKETKGLKLSVYADNENDANSKVWQRISVNIKPDEPMGSSMFDEIFGGFK